MMNIYPYTMKRKILFPIYLFFFFGLPAFSQGVLENADFRLELDSCGRAVSLVTRENGEECLASGVSLPAFSVLQYRPYDNEIQLTRVTRPTVFPAERLTMTGDTLLVGFRDLDYEAVIIVQKEDHFMGFRLEYFRQKEKMLGVKLEGRIDEVVFLQLPVKERRFFGEWLDVVWDTSTAVSLLATDVHTRIDDLSGEGYHLLRAGSVRDLKLTGTGAALVVSPTKGFLDRIAEVEKFYHLPGGVAARRDRNYKESYYECRDVTPANIEQHIRYAKMAGFRFMVIYYPDFASSMGHFPWREEYAGGMKDLQYVTGKMREAGMVPGFHIHYNKAQINDAYVTPVPDPRLNLRKIFTLAEPLEEGSTVITTEESPRGITLFEGRRLLRIGNEIIEYEAYTTTRPYRFTGCKRGVLDTKPARYARGRKLGLLDVDNWPIFIRFDQRTSLQDEVADRIENFVKEAGFRFIYFDGAEDVNRPYWFNVSLSMDRVYEKLDPEPLFCEGACKTHFDWHILSRGNAFDTFEPEEIKKAVDKRHIPAAAYNAENFTGVNFGWVKYTPPGEETVGIQPDMVAYIAAHAAGWDSPLSLLGDLKNFRDHPRTKDNLAIFNHWENAKRLGVFTEEQKEKLKKAGREFLLLADGKGGYELHECRQIETGAGDHIRAFLFEKEGRQWVRYWHTSGEALLTLPGISSRVLLYDGRMKKKQVKPQRGKVVLPAGDIRYLSFDLPEEEVRKIFREGIITGEKQ
jgi:hypothetical protein